MLKYKKIILASHLTPGSFEVAEKAQKLAKETNAELHIIHAIENFPIFAYGYMPVDDIEKSIIAEAKKHIEEMGKKLGVPKAHLHVVNKPSKIAILELQEKENADLIVIGSHGNNGIFSSLGSTASAVVNGAQCDVLVVRHKAD